MYFIDHVAKGRGPYTRVGAKTEHFIPSRTSPIDPVATREDETLVDDAKILTNNDPLTRYATG